MEKNEEKIVDKLNHLIALAEDGRMGYENAAKDVAEIEMKNLFSRLSEERAGYVKELKSLISWFADNTANENGGPLGAIHRTLMDLRSVITSGDRDAIIKACLTGEEAAIKNYKEVLEETYITGKVREVLNEQYIGIENAISNIKEHSSKME